METKNIIISVFAIMLISLVFTSFYYDPAVSVAKGSGTVLSDNWWEGLNWIRNNTKECAVVATYWDPGHFITGIARRAVIYDGASQGAQTDFPYNGSKRGLDVQLFENGANQIILYKEGIEKHSRMKDVAISLYTDNETQSAELLNRYKKEGCDELYFIASADLIGKSVWWSYFATWEPTSKGKQYSYLTIQLQQTKPLISENSLVYIYPFSQQQAFVVYQTNQTKIKAFLQQGNQLLPVEKVFYFTNTGGMLTVDQAAEVKGMVWLTPDKGTAVFIPKEIENSMFTRLFFFNGEGLDKFEFVNSWGGEMKLFKVKI